MKQKGKMALYIQLVRTLLGQFEEKKIPMCVVQIPRKSNFEAYFLSRLATTIVEYYPQDVHMDILAIPSIQESTQVFPIQEEENWMSPII